MKRLYFITYRTKDLLELQNGSYEFLSKKINDFFEKVSIFDRFDKVNNEIVEKDQHGNNLVYYEPVSDDGAYIPDLDYIHAWMSFFDKKKGYEIITIILNRNNNIGPWQSYEIVCCLTRHQRKIYWLTPTYFTEYIKDKPQLTTDNIEEFFQKLFSDENIKTNNHQLAELTPKE